MNMVTRVQILDEAVYILNVYFLNSTNTFGKDMNSTILSPEERVGLIGLFNLGMANGLKEEEILFLHVAEVLDKYIKAI